MEQLVLKVLKFDLGCITIHNFMDRFLKAADADVNTKSLANVSFIPLKYLIVSYNNDFVSTLPS